MNEFKAAGIGCTGFAESPQRCPDGEQRARRRVVVDEAKRHPSGLVSEFSHELRTAGR